MTTSAQRWANASREGMDLALFSNGIIKFPHGSPCFNGSSFGWNVDIDGSKVEEIEDDEGLLGDVRETFVIMAAAADSDL